MMREIDRDDEAATWVDRLDHPAMDAALGAEFDRWMDSAPHNAEAFCDAQALWQSEALRQVLQQCATADAQDGRRARRWSLPRTWKPAAVAAVCVGLLCATLLFRHSSLATYRTDATEEQAIVLADGSHVDLSGDSELQVRILPWRRSATLAKGEAFFDIAHDPSRAFQVDAGGTFVQVLGTAFNVDRQSATRVAIEVYRGVVEVQTEDQHRMVLRRGERTNVANGRIAPRGQSAQESPEWKSGWFEADNVPLAVLIAKVQRHARQTIEIEGDGLEALPISGRFKIAAPARVLSSIEEAYDLKISKVGETIRISPPGRP